MSPPVERAGPPETRRDVITETLHDTDVPDPYRWLEADDEAVAEWTDAQNDYADAVLDTPIRDRLRPRLEPLAEVADDGPVAVRGGRYFQTVERPGDDHGRCSSGNRPTTGRCWSTPTSGPRTTTPTRRRGR